MKREKVRKRRRIKRRKIEKNMSDVPNLKRRSSTIGEWEFEDASKWYPCLQADSKTIQNAVGSGGLPKTIKLKNQYGSYSICIHSDRKATQTNLSSKRVRKLRFRFLQDEGDKKSWSCSACTFINMSMANKCAICGIERPSTPLPPHPKKKRSPWNHPKCVSSIS